MSLLADASAALSASLDYETTLATVSRLSLPDLADWCFTDVITPTGELRRLSVSHSSDLTMQRLLDEYQRNYPPQWDNPSIPIRAMRLGEPIHVRRVPPEALRQMVGSEEQWRRVVSLRIGSVVSVPMRARGETLGAMTFVRHPERAPFEADDVETLSDLTQRGAHALDSARLYDAAQAANRAKDELMATLSHELRTPLNVILGYSRILGSEPTHPEGVKRLAHIIERNAVAQLRIVEDLLDVQRMLKGQLRIEPEELDLSQLGQAVMESLNPSLAAKGLHWSGHFELEPLVIKGDRARIQQVLWNLIANAIKFTPSGGCIGVSAVRENRTAVIRVQDSGEGIPPPTSCRTCSSRFAKPT